MSDHADIQTLLADLYQRGQDGRDGDRLRDEIVRALDSLVAERDEWASKAQEHLAGWNMATNRAEAAEARQDGYRESVEANAATRVAAEAERDEARQQALDASRVGGGAMAEVARLREALRSIAERDPYPGVLTRLTAKAIACATLDAGKEGK